jgi:hypothetical protein
MLGQRVVDRLRAAVTCELSEGGDYVGQGRIFGYCSIGPGIRGGLIDVVPSAEDGDGRLRMATPDLGHELRPFAVGERQVE